MSDDFLSRIRFSDDGLVPVIAQQFDSGEVLMMAWMNAEALRETLNTGRACYWSRSRQKLWRKGETSGQSQLVKDLIVDCDGDTILLQVDQHGVACHTGRRTCFFNVWRNGQWTTNQAPTIDPSALYPTPES